MTTELLSCVSHKDVAGDEPKTVWLVTRNNRPFFITLLRQVNGDRVWFCSYVGLTSAECQHIKMVSEDPPSYLGLNSQLMEPPSRFNDALNIPRATHCMGFDFPPAVDMRTALARTIQLCDEYLPLIDSVKT